MRSHAFADGFEERLLTALARDWRLLGPVRGSDGVCRLAPVRRWGELSPGALPLIPLKKVLLPPVDPLWTLSGNTCTPSVDAAAVALLGIPPCDLYALAYLDRVFADDPLYQRRKERLFLVGSACTPGPGCFCPPWPALPPFDLFLADGRVWAGSAQGERVLEGFVAELGAAEERPLPAEVACGKGLPLPPDLERLFHGSSRSPLWREVGEKCVSCGACSAVCPTCYCYEVVDAALPDGTVTRRREWDNCFFRSHALVAGGHNFRPTRSERLRFRFEHKLLGFGALRGASSCVGCGRCGRACPVDIDLAEVLVRLVGEGRGT
jgi:ferredoxin